VIEVHSDRSGNLLTIVFSGTVTADDARKWSEQVIGWVAEMQPGFQLLADLTTLELMENACAPFIAKVMDHCNEKGVRKILRVIPDPRKDIGLKILSLFHYDRDVRIATFENLADAQKAISVTAATR